MFEQKLSPSSKQSTLARAEQAVLPSRAPRMLIHDHIRSILTQSGLVRDAIQTAVADSLAGAIEVNRSKVFTETSLRKMQIFVAHAEKSKALTPKVVHSAIEISASIESARPIGYAVIDQATREATAIIAKSAEGGSITAEEAQRRLTECERAYYDDVEFFHALINTAKDTNRHLAQMAVARVRSGFGDSGVVVDGDARHVDA